MKLNELIKKYKKLEGVWNAEGAELARQIFLQDLEQLDKPQPVKVKKFVADFIAEQKKLGHTLSYSIDASMSDIVAEWYWDNSELFALAWIFGYEVEEEKRYTVVTKATKQPLYYNAMDKKLFFSMGGLATKFTRKQLKEADLGWVFDCPGIEIEEVEYDTNA
ncbi:DUF1642 domain-containing protein [Streptococcus pneumoniae]|uniref:Phage protein n=2 Tax=Streptococcus pneumoniae TaxID=1313 RepID=A0AA95IJW8_STREE|nr:DUF1642 domain-containing protein [Streptococcus pneumoniae]MDS2295440.1 DUF1642 domain-containing protein [Streptococcus pneumoniae]MDS2574842.1 DUF1642 domain-containing protein [Streptococcus pneumoniae]MDS2653382.1 DUF1642 domain-containing protein [Streptococcus pneumoniae]MDS2764470.1 DUF1642 domain-containing protein [Streptococcus pneumoniae]MDS3357531.1 DUF1642 domain-containing protein [Streptococcus pneumoniae]